MNTQACRSALKNNAREQGAHAGLLLSRFLQIAVPKKGDNSDSGTENNKHPGERLELYGLAKTAAEKANSVYEHAYERRLRHLRQIRPYAEGSFSVQGRLIVGLGGENVLETGITLHHTYGVPIIPGSALKGLASHYCDQVWGEANPEFKIAGVKDEDDNGKESTRQGKYHRVLFGANDDSGHIIFHDAWITPDSLQEKKQGLVLDVMTPHHGDYYAEKKDEKGKLFAPTDFDDPNPVTFLSVTGVVHVALSCDEDGEQGEQWIKLALGLVTEALEHWGVGGKTNAGYGRLNEAVASSVPPNRPRYKSRDQVIATRVEDPKEKGRIWFQADDGFGGRIISGNAPNVALGETVTLWVVSVSNGYNFSCEPLGSTPKNTQKRR